MWCFQIVTTTLHHKNKFFILWAVPLQLPHFENHKKYFNYRNNKTYNKKNNWKLITAVLSYEINNHTQFLYFILANISKWWKIENVIAEVMLFWSIFLPCVILLFFISISTVNLMWKCIEFRCCTIYERSLENHYQRMHWIFTSIRVLMNISNCEGILVVYLMRHMTVTVKLN